MSGLSAEPSEPEPRPLLPALAETDGNASSTDLRRGTRSGRGNAGFERRDGRKSDARSAGEATRNILTSSEETEGEPLAPLAWTRDQPGRAPADTASDTSGCIDFDGLPYSVWTGGYVNFGSKDGVADVDFTTTGVSVGIDYRINAAFTAGIAVGYGSDDSDIGSNGTSSDGRAYSAAVYGSYHPTRNTFLDALVGYGILDFDSTRYVTTDGSFANGQRDGNQIFGSVTAGYEYRDGGLLLSPYGRLSASHTKLDGFTEEGDSDALKFDDMDFSTLTSTLGLRGEYTIQRSWGSISPQARLEYSHDFDGSSRQKVGYADLGSDEMSSIHDNGEDDDYLALGLGLDIEAFEIWSFGLEYQTAIGQEDEEQHRIQARIAARF